MSFVPLVHANEHKQLLCSIIAHLTLLFVPRDRRLVVVAVALRCVVCGVGSQESLAAPFLKIPVKKTNAMGQDSRLHVEIRR